MTKFGKLLLISALVSPAIAGAQNTFPASGNVGIGTANPGSPLDVMLGGSGVSISGCTPPQLFGCLAFNRESSTGAIFNTSAFGYQFTHRGSTTANSDYLSLEVYAPSGSGVTANALVANGQGYVGIGTATPIRNLTVNGETSIVPNANNGSTAYLNVSDASGSNGESYNLMIRGLDNVGTAGGSLASIDLITNKVGIGTSSPNFALDVSGQIHASGGVVFPDGTTQNTAFNPAICGADYAESVDVTGDRTHYEPGDVLVIDPNEPGKFLKSNQPYSTMVAGVYSTKPGFVGRLHPADDPASANEVPMAMVGRVPTKVSAENGPINVGDLLVASSTLGRAMKATDRTQLTGAVIGKALGSLDSGVGVIQVLVTLQ